MQMSHQQRESENQVRTEDCVMATLKLFQYFCSLKHSGNLLRIIVSVLFNIEKYIASNKS